MTAKRALVVDDSRSARAFLARILERHEIAVDAAESAEAAIQYLDRNRPDIIFMDHMMPGMDGFQAVQTIKNNPRTSSIPILMYTSQEGDLYLGQARALGAEGVLPKQIKQADVTRMLYQLRLVADRRGEEQTTFARLNQSAELLPANESAIVVETRAEPAADAASPASGGAAVGSADVAQLMPQMSLEIKAALDGPLQRELAALRGFINAALDAQTDRLHGDIAALVPVISPAPLDTPALMPERRPWAAITGWCVALLASAGAAVLGWFWWQQGGEIAALRGDLAASYAEVEALRARPVVVSPAPGAAGPAVTDPEGGATALVPASDLDAAAPASPTQAGPTQAGPTADSPAVVSPTASPAGPSPAVVISPAPAPAVSATVVPAAQAQ